MLLNGHIVDIEKTDRTCSLTFVVDDFSILFLHQSIFSIKDLRSCINNKSCFIKFLLLIKF